jgi:hypothetical protein
MDPEMSAEGFTRLTYEIDEIQGGVCKLTVTHELDSAPKLSVLLAGGAGGPGCGRRLDLGAQRPQVGAGDRQGDGRLA